MKPDQHDRRIRAEVWLQGAAGIGLALLALILIATFLKTGAGLNSPVGWIAVAYGIGLLLFGMHEYRIARGRDHGMRVEQRALAEATKVLPRYGYACFTNLPVPGLGDIDLVVSAGAHRVPVEIKSYREWGGERASEALEQTEKQRVYLRAERGYLWLPEAKVGFWRRWRGEQRGAITVAFGGAKNLATVIRRGGVR